jgi:hypothetical protein
MGKSSGKSMLKVVYKPDTMSTEEFILIVDPEEVCGLQRLPNVTSLDNSLNNPMTYLV